MASWSKNYEIPTVPHASQCLGVRSATLVVIFPLKAWNTHMDMGSIRQKLANILFKMIVPYTMQCSWFKTARRSYRCVLLYIVTGNYINTSLVYCRIKCLFTVGTNMNAYPISKCECRVSSHLHRYLAFCVYHLINIFHMS